MRADFDCTGNLPPRWRWLCVTLSLALIACHPDLDWREVSPREGGFSVLMPARAHEQSRPLSGVDGNPVMYLWSAKASETLFGAGYLEPNSLSDARLMELRDALVRNIGGTIVSDRPVRTDAMKGIEFDAVGTIGGTRAHLHARLLISGNRIFQLAVLGPAGALAPADRDMFFESFRLQPIRPQPQ